MGIYFNAYCDNLEDFRVMSEKKQITIRAERIADSNVQSVIFYASNGEDEQKLILEMQNDGICCFIPFNDGKRCDPCKHYDQNNFGHYDNGFLHYAQYGKSASCSYNDARMVSIEVEKTILYITCNLPSRIQEGLAVREFSFRQLAHQLLLCFAKLFASYAFSSTECDVIGSICPKIIIESRTEIKGIFEKAANRMSQSD